MKVGRPGGKISNKYETGYDEVIHVIMNKSSKLKRRVKFKAFELGYKMNEYLLALLTEATKDVVLPEDRPIVKAPKIKPRDKNKIS